MSWIEKLHKTYENNTCSIGKGETPLLPICHTTQKAHITIILDREGNFAGASVVPKDDARTIIPATEESAGRTGKKPTCFPLCDKLQYISGDFVDYGGVVTSGFSNNPKEPYNEYIKILTDWCESEFAHSKVKSVLHYVRRGYVIKDLIEKKVLIADSNGKLLNQWTEKQSSPDIFKLLPGGKDNKGKDKPWQAGAFIRWAVEIPGDCQSNLWDDKTVWKSWQEYYSNLRTQKGFCHISGETVVLADQHPAKIRNDGDKAKLISSNDNTGFTFRGRFTNSSEACGIGFEVTQKAHSALRWLIAKQGYRDGEQAIIAWAVSGADVPNPVVDTFTMLFKGQEETANLNPEYTAEEIGIEISKLSSGYSAKLGNTDDVVIIGIDSATPGRMAISFYRELTSSEFLNRVLTWHDLEKGCVWRQYFAKDKIFVGAPAPRDIAECAYGRRDDKLRKATVERLLPCIVDGIPIPHDIVESCVHRGSNRQGIEFWEWEKALGIACALFKHQHKERNYKMSLERDRKTRDYLYGRLLSVAEFMEGLALKVAGEDRDTNAARLMQRFADHPYSTWRNIELALAPYKTRLRAKRPGFLSNMEKELDEIQNLFQTEEYMTDNTLSGEFLIAYHCERKWLWDSIKEKAEDFKIEEISNNQKGE